MSSLMDLLGPGGAPGGGLPPTIPDPEPHKAPGNDPLAALLGGGGAPPPGGPDADQAADLSGVGDTDTAAAGAPDTGAQTPSAAPNAHVGKENTTLQSMITMADSFRAIPTVEPAEAAKMAKISAQLHDLLAANQSQADSLSGANPALRKALGPRGG